MNLRSGTRPVLRSCHDHRKNVTLILNVAQLSPPLGRCKIFQAISVSQKMLIFENWTFFALELSYITIHCFSSKCTHNTSFKGGQTERQKDFIFMAAQLEAHHCLLGLCDLDGCAISACVHLAGTKVAQSLIHQALRVYKESKLR